MNEPTVTTGDVSPDTDDLDAFTTLFESKEAPKTEEVKDAPVDDEDSDDEDSVATETEDDDTTTEDTPDEDEASEEDEGDKPEDSKGKKPNKFQERINQLLTREREAREREAAAQAREKELQQRLDNLSAKQSETTPVTTVTQSGPAPTDLNEDGSDKYPLGEFDPNYIRDLTRHTIQAEQQKSAQEQAQKEALKQEQEIRDSLQEKWTSNLAPFVEQHDDFLEKTLELETTFDGLDAGYSDYLVQTIKNLDHGPEVLYYFANNLSEAQKFVKMGPQAATLALGEINAMFKGQTRKEPNKVSKAPPPPQLNKGSKTRTSVAADTDDLDAFSETFFKRK